MEGSSPLSAWFTSAPHYKAWQSTTLKGNKCHRCSINIGSIDIHRLRAHCFPDKEVCMWGASCLCVHCVVPESNSLSIFSRRVLHSPRGFGKRSAARALRTLLDREPASASLSHTDSLFSYFKT